MFYPTIQDFFAELSKIDIPVNIIYPDPNDKLSVIEESFYPSLDNFIYESEQIIAGKTLIEDCDVVISPDGTEIDMVALNKVMTKANVTIIGQAPLFGPYVNEFTPIYTFEIKTMATDGVRLFVNPQFAQGLTFSQRIFVLIHEIMHCVMNHMDRMKGRNATLVMTGKDANGNPTSQNVSLFNVAADYEINALIVDTLSKHFSPETVKSIHGLYDVKYLNMPVETIYDMIYDETPTLDMPPQPGDGEPDPKQPPGGGPPPPPQPPGPLAVGDEVRIKSTGGVGRIVSTNPDGTFEVTPIDVNESYGEGDRSGVYNDKINTYKREELIPILPGRPPEGGDGGGGTGPEVEYKLPPKENKDDKGEDKKGKGDGKAKGFKDGKEVELSGGKTIVTVDADPGNTGILISKERGKQIARNAGHGAIDDEDSERKWSNNARKLMDDIDAIDAKSGGTSVGGMLKAALKRMFKGDVNWKEEFANFVATALSSNKKWQLGNRRHMRAGQKILRYGAKKQRDAINNVVVLVDVSGSMNRDWQTRILNEINQIVFSKKVKEITVIFFDGNVHLPSIQKIKGGNQPWIPKNGEVPGGGGTVFQHPLDYVEKFLKNPSLVVFATDGFNHDNSTLKVPTFSNKFIWLLYGSMEMKEMRERFPWGKILKIADEDDIK